MKYKDETLVLGTDPEFAAGYKKEGNVFVLPPAYFREFLGVDYIPDIKHPIFIDDRQEGVKIIEDGAAFEMTIAPSTDWKELFERVQTGKRILLNQILSRFPKECEPEVFSLPTVNYDVERWLGVGEEFANCMEFGCDADYDAFDKNKAGERIDALRHPYRYFGAHVHASGRKSIKENPIGAIQCMAISMGMAFIAFSENPQLEKLRSDIYGKLGKYRPQEYARLWNNIPDTDFGVEYRTPSTSWTSNFEQAEQMFKWLRFSVFNLLETKLGVEMVAKHKNNAKKAIKLCDKNIALSILKDLEARA